MAELKDKLENALNEGRILILGGQVLIGSAYRSFFDPGFEFLPGHSKALLLAGLAVMLLGLGLLLTPASYHRIVVQGFLRQRLPAVGIGMAGTRVGG